MGRLKNETIEVWFRANWDEPAVRTAYEFWRQSRNDCATCEVARIGERVAEELELCRELLTELVSPPLRYSDKQHAVDRARLYLEGWQG